MRRTETPKPIWIKFCTVVVIADVVTYTNFGDHRLRGFWVAGGQISPSPIDFRRRPYNTLAIATCSVRVCWCAEHIISTRWCESNLEHRIQTRLVVLFQLVCSTQIFGFILICLFLRLQPFPQVYFAENVVDAIFPVNSWLSFQRLCRLLWRLLICPPHLKKCLPCEMRASFIWSKSHMHRQAKRVCAKTF